MKSEEPATCDAELSPVKEGGGRRLERKSLGCKAVLGEFRLTGLAQTPLKESRVSREVS